MRKLSNIEAELKKRVANKENACRENSEVSIRRCPAKKLPL